MEPAVNFSRSHARHFTAIILFSIFYANTGLPILQETAKDELSKPFVFERSVRGQHFEDPNAISVRTVRPGLKRIDAWISSVGAAVALNDLDGNGKPDDTCYVDTQINKLVVEPVPGTHTDEPSYLAFTLDPTPLPYNTSKMAPMGCLPGDFNEDGLMDILVYYWGRTPVLFLHKKDGFSKTKPIAAGSYIPTELVPVVGEKIGDWYTNAATLADLDGDGHVDLLLGNYFPDGSQVLDVTATGHVNGIMQDSMSRAYNGGGLRLFLWKSATSGTNPTVRFEETHEFVQKHTEKEKGSLPESIGKGWVLALGATDVVGEDLRPEIYIANDFGPDALLHNITQEIGKPRFEMLTGRKTLTTPNSKVLGWDSFKGMGVEFGDLNGDGLLDIFVGNVTSTSALLESNFAWINTGKLEGKKAPFKDDSESLGLSRSGWAWDARIADFNNDGIPELIQAVGFVQGDVNRWPELQELAMGSDHLLRDPRSWPRFQKGDDLSGPSREHNHFFVRAKNGRYFDISENKTKEGQPWLSRFFAKSYASIGNPESNLSVILPEVSRGIATADVDGDGLLDFAIATQWGPTYFYHNKSPHPGAFLGLRLMVPLDDSEGMLESQPGKPRVGRPAIGAQAIVTLPNGKKLISQVDGGTGHSGKKSPDIHFGLGSVDATRKLSVTVRWRDSYGPHQTKLNLSPNCWHTILLGRDQQKEPSCRALRNS